jgi:hypothetical protein
MLMRKISLPKFHMRNATRSPTVHSRIPGAKPLMDHQPSSPSRYKALALAPLAQPCTVLVGNVCNSYYIITLDEAHLIVHSAYTFILVTHRSMTEHVQLTFPQSTERVTFANTPC